MRASRVLQEKVSLAGGSYVPTGKVSARSDLSPVFSKSFFIFFIAKTRLAFGLSRLSSAAIALILRKTDAVLYFAYTAVVALVARKHVEIEDKSLFRHR